MELKLILLIINLSFVLSGRCPPEEVYYPCYCSNNYFACPSDILNFSQVFKSISNNLNETEKHFEKLNIYNDGGKEVNLVLNDTSFWDITFDIFYSSNLMLISNDAFGKSYLTVKKFMNWGDSFIKNSPPNYNIWKTIGKFVQLEYAYFHLNVTEIPSNAFIPFNGKQLKLNFIEFNIANQFTIKRMSFYNLENITKLFFYGKTERIEREAFAFSKKSKQRLLIDLTVLNGSSFEPRSFDGVQRPIDVRLSGSNYLPDSSFKSVLDKEDSRIIFDYDSHVNCSDCQNHWLIRDGKDRQVYNAFCIHNKNITLFSPQIKYELNSKCKTKNKNLTLY